MIYAGPDKKRVYKLESGDVEERIGGSVSWRNNNPGNLKLVYAGSADKTVKTKRTKAQALASARARYPGVIDLDAYGNAIFATEALGRASKERLLKSERFNKPLEEMLALYAKDDYTGKANPAEYAKSIRKLASSRGLDLAGKKISEMSEDEFNTVVDGIKKMEGFVEGKMKLSHGSPSSSEGKAQENRPSSSGVTINQSTTVNVTGATDPSATATAVSGAQSQVNQQLARNARSAVVG